MSPAPAEPAAHDTNSLNTQLVIVESSDEFRPEPATGAFLEYLKAKRAKIEAAQREREQQQEQPPSQD